ncbi:MAG: hypothetical protein ABR954_01060 [Dehalococcoidales bacterium]
MGFFSLIKKIFAGESADEEELDAARKRHGIVLTQGEKAEANKSTTEAERFAEEYDVWEDLKNYRWNFFVGRWAARKFHPIGEDKVKRDLERLERKRQKETERKKEGG